VRRVVKFTESQGVDGRDVDHLCTGGPGGGSDITRSLNVDLPVLIELAPAEMDISGRMDHDVDALAGGSDGGRITNVAGHALDRQTFQPPGIARRSVQHA